MIQLKKFSIGLFVALGVTSAQLFAATFNLPTDLPSATDPTLVDALFAASLTEYLIIGSVLIFAIIGAMSVIGRIIGKKRNLDGFLEEKAKLNKRIVQYEELNEELSEEREKWEGKHPDKYRFELDQKSNEIDALEVSIEQLKQEFLEIGKLFEFTVLDKNSTPHEIAKNTFRELQICEESAREAHEENVKLTREIKETFKKKIEDLPAAIAEYEPDWMISKSQLLTQVLSAYTDEVAFRLGRMSDVKNPNTGRSGLDDYKAGLFREMRLHFGKISEILGDEFEAYKSLSYVSEEAKRIAQYDAILRLYNEKISALREQQMDEEDQEEAIIAMKRLRDREIDNLEQS